MSTSRSLRSRLSLLLVPAFAAGWGALSVGCYDAAGDCNLFACGTGGSTTSTTSVGGGGTSGSGGSTGTSGTGGSTPEECVPSEANGPVADGCGVFVDPAGADDGLGTKDSPLRTLAAAITAAKDKSSRVYACAVTFTENVAIASNVTVYGGLDCAADWEYAGGSKRTVWTTDPDRVPVQLTSGISVSLLDVDVVASDSAAPGGSSIAVIADAGSTLSLTRCSVTAGAGADGMSGGNIPGTGAMGETGPDGLNACTALEVHTPDPPINACPDVMSVGGAGGLGGALIGGAGTAGAPGADNKGLGEGAAVCTDGGPGATGADGAPGLGGGGLGAISASGYLGVNGSDGTTGAPGQGGGGGGGGKGGTGSGKCASAAVAGGASGGAGGSGGCGGQGGIGGQAGGSSIGILSLGASLSFTDVDITSGKGALGGAGGTGQSGGFGGFGGVGGLPVGTLHAGCNGGQGGKGGKGGTAGGGLGGHSIGVAYSGAAPDLTGATILPGAAGDGGPGDGVDATTAGAAGVAMESQAF